MRKKIANHRALAPLLCLAAVALIPGCNDGDPVGPPTCAPDCVPATPLTWDLVVIPANLALQAGESIQLDAYLQARETGAYREAGGVEWLTSDPKIAMVMGDGLVEAYGAGDVIITAFLVEPPPHVAPGSDAAEATLLVR